MQVLWRPMRVLLGLLLRRPLVGACIIPILPNGQVVLIRRRDTGLWALPGGLVDWGEDIATAAQRELAEETGLRVTQVGRLVGVYSQPGRDPRFHSVCVLIELCVAGQPTIHDLAEVMEIQAFPLAEAIQLPLDHDHICHIKDYLADRTVLA
ncbi:MAG: NUDIX hydrolase [Cyanobacteria bacterium P01_H01_bin.58]